MNFVMLNNCEFMTHLRHWSRWLLGYQLTAPKATPKTEATAPLTAYAAVAEIANADSSPPPHPLPTMTPQNWLAKQPPYNTVVAYIHTPSCQLMELLSIPRHKLPDVLNIPMYRNPAATWQQVTDRCLRRTEFDPATEWFEHVDALEQLAFLQSARLCVSAEMASLDLLITTLYAEVCVELGIETPIEAACNSTDAGENARAKANASDTPLRKSPASLPPAALFSAVNNATDRTAPANNWQLFGSLLNQRQRASTEMVQLDAALLPQFQKLGVKNEGG